MTGRKRPRGFAEPIFVTRPVLPPLSEYTGLLSKIWEKRWLTNRGEMLCTLEQNLKQFLGVRHLALVANGTLALQLAIKALKLEGEVITTPFTFPATPHVLTWAGIKVVFADVDEETLTIDPAAIQSAISVDTTGILGVHVYGMPCDVLAIDDICQKHRLRVLYDGAHAFDTRLGAEPLANFGDATMLSFHATKLFHSVEGGAVVSKDTSVIAEVDLLKNFGIRDEVTVSKAGINAKMNELQAAMGLLVLERVETERAARLEIIKLYQDRLERLEGLRMFRIPKNITHSGQYAVLRVDARYCPCDRDQLYARLKTFNIFSRRYFYPLCSEGQHYYGNQSASARNLPVAHRVSREVLALPLFSELGLTGAERVIDAIEYIVTNVA